MGKKYIFTILIAVLALYSCGGGGSPKEWNKPGKPPSDTSTVTTSYKTIVEPDYTTIKVSWEMVEEGSYKVFKSENGSTYVEITSTSEMTMTDANVKAGVKYRYYVESVSAGKKTEESSEFTLKTLEAPEVSVENPDGDSLKINFTMVAANKTNCITYEMERGETGGFTGEGKIAVKAEEYVSGGMKYFTDVPPSRDKVYEYRVVAKLEPYTTNSASCTGKIEKPLPPASVKVDAGGDQMKVAYSESTGATGYYIYRSTDYTKYVRVGTVQGGKSLEYFDTTAGPGTTYYYRVASYIGKNNESEMSQSRGQGTIDIAVYKPGTPTASRGETVLTVGIVAASDVDGYNLYRSSQPNGLYSLVKSNFTEKTVSDDGAAIETLYYYRVKVVRNGNESAFSDSTEGIRTLYGKDSFEEDDTAEKATSVTMNEGGYVIQTHTLDIGDDETGGGDWYTVYNDTGASKRVRVTFIWLDLGSNDRIYIGSGEDTAEIDDVFNYVESIEVLPANQAWRCRVYRGDTVEKRTAKYQVKFEPIAP